MVVIYGKIFYFEDILQIGCEGKLSKLQHAKYWWKLNIPFKYFDTQLTKGRRHHVDGIPNHMSTNYLCSSSYEPNSYAIAQSRALQQFVENDLIIILVSIYMKWADSNNVMRAD